MNPDYSVLTNWADCDAATAHATFELETLQHRDQGYDLADKRADLSQEAGQAALAKKDAEIAAAQHHAAQPGLSTQQKEDAEDVVLLLQAQRKKIVRDNRDQTGSARFKLSVDAAQIAAQAALLQQVLAGIAAHRATLPG
ncbi:hypothetical protein [Hymenobacter sp. B81]|uniref:hypothetical protein n=1 Tax=Hymenobacter sp. B81 TaxID=3344878 RepID=UPI0037DC1181